MHRSALCWGVALVLLVAGCSSDVVATATVTGEVTLDGQPLAEGNIQFRPSAGDGPSAGAKIQAGKFTAEVPLTKMKVEITANKVVGQRKAYNTPDSPTVDEVVELIPERYNVTSQLTLDVQPGMQPPKFELLSK